MSQKLEDNCLIAWNMWQYSIKMMKQAETMEQFKNAQLAALKWHTQQVLSHALECRKLRGE